MRSLEINTITIQLEGATLADTERCRKIIHKLFEVGFFNIKRGKGTVSFDHLGNMGAFLIELKKWERDDDTRRSVTVDNLLESVRVTSK